ncbi:sugar transporter ERD6-like 7 isoform X2 [Phalaenopsis equestris]|uniref:sugar transporter ERD6-like 7 isoform X2 n=1 Tax=Phalaenopsis equestris TaxID=78828 RepID=UPI0009E1F021|nr:sugar transporter ERD6-like 7 isoform X2 [Phalaenopsis equestris]
MQKHYKLTEGAREEIPQNREMAINKDMESWISSEQNGSVEPLIQQANVKTNKRSIWMILFSTVVVVCGSFVFGSCVGFSAPSQSAIMNDMGLSLSEFAVFGSILTIGAMIGAIASGRIADFLGRKGAMRVSALFGMVGWLAIYFGKNVVLLDFGRISTGFGTGVFSYVVPVFIAEIAPKNLRGGLTALNQLMICGGLSVTYIVGTLVSWRELALIGLIPCVILLFGLFFIPESPRWLAKVGQQELFEESLRRLHGKDADISEEAAEIQDYIETLNRLPKAKIVDLFQRKYIRSTIVGVGLMAFQQFGGINGIVFYSSQTFVSAGFSSGNFGTILIGAIQLPITALGAILTDNSGRKPLLLISSSGTFLGCFIAALSFFLQERGVNVEWNSILTLCGILIYIGSFAMGMGAIPWIIMSEIFPINIKGTAGSLVTLMNWFGSWLLSYSFNFLMSWSSWGTFLIFTVICAANVVFVLMLVPETKGRTLEEVQSSMNS